MSMYTHGKMPKALNHVTKLDKWADLLRLSQPENWSPNAMYKATIMFASSSKAGRFFELFLLPRVKPQEATFLPLPIFEKDTLQAQRILLWNINSPV